MDEHEQEYRQVLLQVQDLAEKCPMFKWFDTKEEKIAKMQSFGRKCLNCGDQGYFLRNCPGPYKNVSGVLNPMMNNGSKEECAARWERETKRLREWHEKSRS